MGAGYSIRTYKVRLYDRHHDRLVQTKDIYNRAVQHYYHILCEEPELLEQPGFELLRTLEKLTVGTKEMKAAGQMPEYPLAITVKLPLYLRRAAINAAVGMARGHENQVKRWQEYGRKGTVPAKPMAFDAAPVFYQGMYRNFTEKSVELKVFNGQKWSWTNYPFAASTLQKLPPEGNILSPTLVFDKKDAWLHIPVETAVPDARTVEERMKNVSTIAAVSVPGRTKETAGGDILAACVVLAKDGRVEGSRFFYGGKQRTAKRTELLGRLEKSQKSRTGTVRAEKDEKKSEVTVGTEKDEKKSEITVGTERIRTGENAAIYRELKDLNLFYAHKISREILDYCTKQDIKVIVVPNYGDVAKKRKNPYEWLGRAILGDLKYKAFAEGVVVTGVRAYHMQEEKKQEWPQEQKKGQQKRQGQPAWQQIQKERGQGQQVQQGCFNKTRGRLYCRKAVGMEENTNNIGNTAVTDAAKLGRYFLGLF